MRRLLLAVSFAIGLTCLVLVASVRGDSWSQRHLSSPVTACPPVDCARLLQTPQGLAPRCRGKVNRNRSGWLPARHQ